MLETDLLLDRRRLKRRLNLWRVATILLVVAGLGVLAAPRIGAVGQHVERVNVSGIITENRRLLEAVQALARDRSVSAVIVSINSPGGSVAGGESLRDALLRVAEAKPLVAVMHGLAASAGYMVALPAARIFARESTLTGSIGVILETGEVSGLLGKLGVSVDAITSGPLKDQPSITRPLTPQGREYLNGLVADMFDQFVFMVAKGRNIEEGTVRKLADGRAYTGRQALKLGLIDEIGGETEAREWLAKNAHVSTGLPIHDLRPGGGFVERTFGAMLGDLQTLLLGRIEGGAWSIWTGLTPS